MEANKLLALWSIKLIIENNKLLYSSKSKDQLN